MVAQGLAINQLCDNEYRHKHCDRAPFLQCPSDHMGAPAAFLGYLALAIQQQINRNPVVSKRSPE
jgi:hypothetical protein